MSYKYKSPTEMGYKKTKLTKKQHEEMFGKKSKIIKYEYYKDENSYEVHKFQPLYITLINIIMLPLLILWFGVSCLPELIDSIYKLLFPKKTGNFTSRTYILDDQKRKEFQKTLDLIK